MDEPQTWQEETLYKSLRERNVPNNLASPPVEADKSVTKKCYRQNDRQGDYNIAPTN